MSVVSRLNGTAAVCAVTLAVGLSAFGEQATTEEAPAASPASSTLTDADGRSVPVRPYARIVSASVIADGLLLELSDPERILALSGYGAEHLPYGYRYAGRKLVQSERDTEGILALHPDLVLFHSFGSPARVALLREAGVAAFSLGEMRGVVTFLANARTVATLLGHPERGERFATNFLRRFNQVAADLDPAKRRRALYLGSYGNRIYGGAAGSSYHDVLEHAGLIDAAKGYEGWPQYSPEQVLSLDPEVIVTKPGMTSVICRTAGLERLAACARNGFVEIDSDVLDDPGLLMLDAAEAVYDRVYGGDHGQ